MANRTSNWLARHKTVVLALTFLCGLLLAEAPTLVREEGPADLTIERFETSLATTDATQPLTLAVVTR